MAVRLALHIRGFPPVNYSTLRLVALNYLNIPSTGLQQILEILAEVEFVKLQTEGRSIKTVVPTVPYYDIMSNLGNLCRRFAIQRSGGIEHRVAMQALEVAKKN